MDDPRRGLAEAFGRVVDAIPHEPEFTGIEIVEATAQPRRRETALAITVDREGGVDMATCERIAARVNAALEAYPEPYTLEVGSAGLNRPLTAARDYDRFAGREVKIVTTLPIGGAKTHRGRLVGLRVNVAVLAQGDTELPIPLEVVKSANLEYDPRDDFRRAKAKKKTEDDER